MPFMEPNGSLPCSKEQDSGLYPELLKSSPHPLSLFKILPDIIILPSGLFPSGLSTEILYTLLISMHATCPIHLILLDLIALTPPPSTVHFLSHVQISYSVPCSQTLSIYLIPIGKQFHAHIKQVQLYSFVHFHLQVLG